jgi:mannose-6-phosphate isomerase-like protein (cupin superfamily)
MKNISVTTLFLVGVLACSDPKQTNEKKDSQNSNMMDQTVDQTTLKGFQSNIEKDVLANKDFRKVVYTAKHLQLVLMTLKVGEEIGEETHPAIDQFFRFESGNGKCIINANTYMLTAGDAIIIPAGAKHNIINVDEKQELKMYTIYAAPNHKDGTVRTTKKEAEDIAETFDGKTTE